MKAAYERCMKTFDFRATKAIYILCSLVIYESDLNCLHLCLDFGFLDFPLRFTVGNCVSV